MLGSPPHTWRKLVFVHAFGQAHRITSTYVEKTAGTLIIAVVGSGSPPHTWRKLSCCHVTHWKLRITSTYVEKTEHLSNLISRYQDHLHIRGENKVSLEPNQTQLGSPPHTWRKHIIIIAKLLIFSITSTYVEKTLMFFTSH